MRTTIIYCRITMLVIKGALNSSDLFRRYIVFYFSSNVSLADCNTSLDFTRCSQKENMNDHTSLPR